MSIYKRAPTFLVLCGEPGIGKTTLKHMVTAMHGHKNASEGKKSSITDKFNSQIAGVTLLWFDELSYDEKMENTMKEMPNDKVAIEKKGADAKSRRIYASLVVTNNNLRDNFIRFDSRKFAPLLMTTKILYDSLSPEEVGKIHRMTDPLSKEFDIEALAELAKWLKKYGPGYAARYQNLEYKGPMFWRLAHASMSKWQDTIATFLLTPEKFQSARLAPDHEVHGFRWSKYEMPIRRMLKHYNNWPLPETIRKFMNLYRNDKGEKVFRTRRCPGAGNDFFFKMIERKNAEEDIDLL